MIETIRTRLSSRSYKALLWICIISLAGIASLPSIFKSFLGTYQSYAVVNGWPISLQEFRSKQQQLEWQIQSYRERLGGGAQADKLLAALGISTDTHEMALKQLVDETLILQLAQKNNIVVSPEFIAVQLSNPQTMYEFLGAHIPPFLFKQDGTIDTIKLGRFLQRQGSSVEKFEQDIENDFIRALITSIAQEAQVVSSAELQAEMLQKEAARTFSVTEVSIKPYIDAIKESSLSENDIAVFFEQKNREDHTYWTPELRSATVWVFNAKDYGLSAPTNAEIEKAYNAQKDTIYKGKSLASVKKEISAELSRKQFQAAFEQDAQHLKTDHHEVLRKFAATKKAETLSINQQPLHSKNIPHNLGSPLFQLKNVRQRTTSIEGDKAFIVELTELKQPVAQPLAQVKNQVTADLRQAKALDQLSKEILSEQLSYPAHTKEVSWSNHGSHQGFDDLVKKGIGQEKLLRLIKPGMKAKSMTDTHGFIITLVSITSPAAFTTNSARTSEIGKELIRAKKRLVVEGLIASLRGNATITSSDSSNTRAPEPINF